MRFREIISALFAVTLAIVPAFGAEQASYVAPLAGPMNMATLNGNYINPALRALATCSWGSSAPANGPSAAALPYQCWADTTSNPVLFKHYDGASWVTYASLNTSTHVWIPYRSGAPIVAVATSGSAADLTTGTLPAARLPNPSASTLGGVQSKTCSASQWLTEITTAGVPNCAQPNFTDLAGAASLAQLPAFSGMTAAAAAADADTFPTNQGAGNLKQTLAAIKTWIKAWIVKADVGLANVDNTSDVTKWAAAKALTNTTYNCGSTGNVCTVRLASDITGFGSGMAGWLATPSSANLAATLTDETGTGASVFANSPALTGAPTAPTATASDNSTKIATTAYVDAQVASGVAGVASIDTATGAITIGGLISRSSQNIRVTAAAQSDQETGTSTSVAVVPGTQKFHPSASKAWASFDGTVGSPTVAAGFNVSSITKNGTGDYTLNLTTAFSSVNYACIATVQTIAPAVRVASGLPVNSSSFRVSVGTPANSNVDANYVSVVCFGDQ